MHASDAAHLGIISIKWNPKLAPCEGRKFDGFCIGGWDNRSKNSPEVISSMLRAGDCMSRTVVLEMQVAKRNSWLNMGLSPRTERNVCVADNRRRRKAYIITFHCVPTRQDWKKEQASLSPFRFRIDPRRAYRWILPVDFQRWTVIVLLWW